MSKKLNNARRSPWAIFAVIAAGLILTGGTYAAATASTEDFKNNYTAEQVERLIRYAAPPAALAVPEVNYVEAQRVAAEYGLPFNAFCAAHRAMLAAAQGVGR